MSILLQGPPVRTLVAESKDIEEKTSSILLISASIFVVIILLMHSGLMYISALINSS
jgi:hypothetical protein